MKPKWRNVLIIVGLLLAVVLLVDFNRRMEELDRLTAHLDAVSAEGTAVIQTQTALAGQVAYATSDSAVREWAYDNKMVLPNEFPVVVVPGENGSPTPEPTLVPQTEELPNWRIWWELFFGSRRWYILPGLKPGLFFGCLLRHHNDPFLSLFGLILGAFGTVDYCR
jgi:hypothetical protein